MSSMDRGGRIDAPVALGRPDALLSELLAKLR